MLDILNKHHEGIEVVMANSKTCEKCGYSNPVYSSKCIKCQNALPKEERKIEVNTASEPKDMPYQKKIE